MSQPVRVDPSLKPRWVLGKVFVLTQVIYAITALACLAIDGGTVPARAQAEPTHLPRKLAQQLQMVMDEKNARTPAQQKIDTFLLMAVKQQRGQVLPFATHGVAVASDDTVIIEIKCPVTVSMTAAIEALGGTVLDDYPRYDLIRARMPLPQIEALAAISAVRSIRSPVPMLTRQNTITTEGDRAHLVDEVRSTFNLDGSGVKVCVISDGVDDLPQRQAAGELPANDVVILPNQAGRGTEGTAMLEIVHDIAPGAALGFATALPNPEQFATNVHDLANIANCHIIVDDIGYVNQSPFQSDPISQAVEQVVADGVVVISAAGNDGSQAKNTSSTYEGDYVDSGIRVEELFPQSTLLGSLHHFPTRDGTHLGNELRSNSLGVALHWTDPLGGSNNDYDLCLVDKSLSNIISCSSQFQDGNDDPFEFIPTAPAGSQAMIINFQSAAAPRFFHLQAFGGLLEEGTNGAIFGHPGTDAAIAVGAINVKLAGTNGVFGPEDTVEAERFSSDRPRRVFFDANGNPLTPQNLASTGGILRQKPDVMAANRVRTTTPGFSTFSGTSAAAPHAAGVAALLLQADPTLTPAQVKNILSHSAMDIEQSGPDQTSGSGVIDASSALDALDRANAELINESLSLGNLHTSIDPNDSRAPGGVFTIEATFINTSQANFSDVFFQVVTLTHDNFVLNADWHPGGTGAQISGPQTLHAGDAFDVVFEIGLQQTAPFRLLVNAFGMPD